MWPNPQETEEILQNLIVFGAVNEKRGVTWNSYWYALLFKILPIGLHLVSGKHTRNIWKILILNKKNYSFFTDFMNITNHNIDIREQIT